jgi:cephalosporin-C deacetylase
MNKFYFLTAFLLMMNLSISGNNVLSPIWKITPEDIDYTNLASINPNEWQDINLLLSWERQGYSWLDGDCTMTNSFFAEKFSKNLQLEFSLQCDVITIFINQVQISESVPNSFWSMRGHKTLIDIPDSILKENQLNQIVFKLSNLSYTGGKSHNFCSIHEAGSSDKTKIDVIFPTNDHIYLENTPQSFLIKTHLEPNADITLIIKDDFHKEWIRKTFNIQNGVNDIPVDLATYNLPPGFYECVVISNGKFHTGVVEWFALQPTRISCDNHTVEGFNEYWHDALSELKAIDPEFQMRKVDSLCSDRRNGYVVEMQSLGGLTIRGYYFVPKSEGIHPVVLHLPGYSYGFEHVDGFRYREGNAAELALCVRGHGISSDVFNPWPEITLWAVDICNKDKQIYRSVYMDCIRAVDFLLSRPEIDHSRIGVAGGSQGGGLALATAGLYNQHIAACAYFDPFLSDIRHAMEIRTMIKKEFQAFAEYPANNCDVNQMINNQDYIDTKGFASRIKCPVYFSAALFDDDCPVHGGFTAFNQIKSPKKFEVFPHDSHLGESGQYNNLFNEVLNILKK